MWLQWIFVTETSEGKILPRGNSKRGNSVGKRKSRKPVCLGVMGRWRVSGHGPEVFVSPETGYVGTKLPFLGCTAELDPSLSCNHVWPDDCVVGSRMWNKVTWTYPSLPPSPDPLHHHLVILQALSHKVGNVKSGDIGSQVLKIMEPPRQKELGWPRSTTLKKWGYFKIFSWTVLQTEYPIHFF